MTMVAFPDFSGATSVVYESSLTNSSPRIFCPSSLVIQLRKAATFPVGSPLVTRTRFLLISYVPLTTLLSFASTPLSVTAWTEESSLSDDPPTAM